MSDNTLLFASNRWGSDGGSPPIIWKPATRASPSLFQLMIVFFSIYSIYWDIFILHAANTKFLPSFTLHCRLSGAKPASDSNTKHTKPFQFNAMQHKQQVPLDLYFLVSSGKTRFHKRWIWLICVFFQPHLLCNYPSFEVQLLFAAFRAWSPQEELCCNIDSLCVQMHCSRLH